MAAPTQSEIKKQIEDNSYKWYVLSVVSGQETMTVENLRERVKKHGLDEDVVDFLVPVTQEISMTKGNKKIKEKKMYPGYVFVKSKMNDKIWYVIRNTPGVRIIVGAETHPIPLTDAEFDNMMSHIQASQERSELVVPFKEGDVVLMKAGDFAGTKWSIREIDAEKGFVIVNVEMLGRLTPVMLPFDKIELVN